MDKYSLKATVVLATCLLFAQACGQSGGSGSQTSGATIQSPSAASPASQLNDADAVQDASSATVVIVSSLVQGSGIIYKPDGYILTNQHVVGTSKEVKVLIPGASGQMAREFTGEVVGMDAVRDIAVVRIHETNLTFANLGNSKSVKAGEQIVALGYPLGQTSAVAATTGTVTGHFTDANLGKLLQTSASMNPGNSGGPLINLKGEVIGIDQSVRLNPRTGEIAPVGFALAIDGVKAELSSLEAGTVVASPRFTNSARNYHESCCYLPILVKHALPMELATVRANAASSRAAKLRIGFY